MLFGESVTPAFLFSIYYAYIKEGLYLEKKCSYYDLRDFVLRGAVKAWEGEGIQAPIYLTGSVKIYVISPRNWKHDRKRMG